MAQDDFNRALSIAEKEYGEQSKEVGDLYITIARYSTSYILALDNAKAGEEIVKQLEHSRGLVETYRAYGLIYETQTYKVARCYEHCGCSYTAKKKL